MKVIISLLMSFAHMIVLFHRFSFFCLRDRWQKHALSKISRGVQTDELVIVMDCTSLDLDTSDKTHTGCFVRIGALGLRKGPIL